MSEPTTGPSEQLLAATRAYFDLQRAYEAWCSAWKDPEDRDRRMALIQSGVTVPSAAAGTGAPMPHTWTYAQELRDFALGATGLLAELSDVERAMWDETLGLLMYHAERAALCMYPNDHQTAHKWGLHGCIRMLRGLIIPVMLARRGPNEE